MPEEESLCQTGCRASHNRLHGFMADKVEVGHLRHLRVYSLALDTVVRTANLLGRTRWGERQYLREQLLRATSSVPANIAEGHARGGLADCNRFLVIAKGSASEASHHLEEARLLGLIDANSALELQGRHDAAERMLNRLIKTRKESPPRGD
jgi:four helix bundle protein